MNTTREPYELLVRWVPAGVPENQYAGTVQAQINFAFVVRDGETVVSWTPDPKGPFHVALTGDNGIPLAEIVPGLNAAALVEIQKARDELSEAESTALAEVQQLRDAASAAAATIERLEQAERAADAEIERLRGEVAALTPPPAPEFPPVSRMQALLALHDAGLLDKVNEVVSASDPRTKLAWETATDFHRSSPTIAALWAAIGGTSDQLDALFVAAKKIEV